MAIKIKYLKTANILIEIYQSVDIKFAFISSKSNGYKQCNDLTKCRDFLPDIIKAHLNKNSVSIWGMEYKYGKYPKIDTTTTRLAVYDDTVHKYPNKFQKDLEFSISLINQFEKSMGLNSLSTVEKALNTDKQLWVFTGPNFWMKAPYLISLYTMLIRLGAKRKYLIEHGYDTTIINDESVVNMFKWLILNYKPQKDNDIEYLNKITNKLFIIVSNTKRLFFSRRVWYNKYRDVNITTKNFHNNTGIVSLCSYTTLDEKLNEQVKKLVNSNDTV